jgi:hypothetical protein
VFLQHLASHDRAVDVACASTPTPSTPLCSTVVDSTSSIKCCRSVLRAADPDPFLNPGLSGPTIRVGHVDGVVLRDVNAARAAELLPLIDECSVLIEDLDAIVVAVADEQPASESIAMVWALNSPGLSRPQALMNLPSFDSDDTIVAGGGRSRRSPR